MENIVVALSGGLDSLVTVALLKNKHPRARVNALFVDYGQAAVDNERNSAVRISRNYGIFLDAVTIDLPFLYYHPLLDSSVEMDVGNGDLSGKENVIVPYRNLILLGIATSLAETINAKQIWVGFDDRRSIKDTSPEFVTALNITLSKASDRSSPTIVTPIAGNAKSDTVKLGIDLKVNFASSWSCYRDTVVPCGKCTACCDRSEAFRSNGVADPAM